MSQTEELSPSAYAVLGTIAVKGPATSYEVKRAVRASIGAYWPIPHAQLYTIPHRLEALGLVRSEPERGGRRRRYYHLTEAGHRALRKWLAGSCPAAEFRSSALLKLQFAEFAEPADLTRLAAEQAEQHRIRIAELLDAEAGEAGSLSARLALELDRPALGFWSALANRPPRPGRALSTRPASRRG